MKRIAYLFLFFSLTFILFSQNTSAQLFDRIKDHVEDKVVEKVDKAIDNATDGQKNPENGNNQPNSNTPDVKSSNPSGSQTSPTTAGPAATPSLASYKNYDFVPGDKIIFVSDFSNQRNAALPARIGLLQGTAQVQTYQGDKVLELERGSSITLIPIMKNKNYLPEQFTLEFDLLVPEIDNGYKHFSVSFFKKDASRENMKYPIGGIKYLNFEIDVGEEGYIDFGETIENKRPRPALSKSLTTPGLWHHIAIYVHNNIGKAYIDQYRVAATNMTPTGLTKLAIKTNGDLGYLMKNVKLAAGGSDAYQKIITDGKFITHGIHFASGKAEILPESMGTINEMYKVLKNHTGLKLEIDGYTDSDGSDQFNLKLSQDRANSVKKQLVSMGIDTSRLTTKGFGESDPIDSNATPEGKANNRRVEFVKK